MVGVFMRAGSFAKFGPLLAAEMMMIDEVSVVSFFFYRTRNSNAERTDRLRVGGSWLFSLAEDAMLFPVSLISAVKIQYGERATMIFHVSRLVADS